MVRILRIHRLARYGGLSALAIAALAQAPPAFEAASIKLSDSQSVRGSDGGPGSTDPGQYRFGRATLLDLIFVAYHVGRFQISSTLPLEDRRFDLVAKIPPGATREEFRAMMQTLLTERFQLKVHMVSKEFPAFDLTVAKGGPKLKEAEPAADARPRLSLQQSIEGGFLVVHVTGRQATIADLAGMLQRPDDPPIADKTGLTGKYDFAFDYTVERAAGPSEVPRAPDLPVALRQQLGLQLVPKKAAFDVVVVDSVAKLPTEN
jgi:uncharacterized protein (TIGR03435 family)